MSQMFLQAIESMIPPPVGGVTAHNAGADVPAGNGMNSPLGNVYQSLVNFPTFKPALNSGAIPPPSNFGSIVFPQKTWDKTANYGDNLAVYQGSDRTGPSQGTNAGSGRRG
jgi:hypothetical protein